MPNKRVKRRKNAGAKIALSQKRSKTGRFGLSPKSTGSRTNGIRSFFSKPAFNIIALMILLLSVYGGLKILTATESQAQIRFIENGEKTDFVDKGDQKSKSPPEIFQGEVYATTIRLRETGALGMAISLAVFGNVEENRGVPPDLNTIWEFINRKNLMPPGLSLMGGELISETSVFLVRFQSQPLQYEILARPRKTKAPSVMMRFPLLVFDGRTISYYQTKSSTGYKLPPPFASPESIVSHGWKIEQWRGDNMPKKANAYEILEKEKRLLLKGIR